MKELMYLNKYLIKYRWRLMAGIGFIALATILQILPAQLVRKSMNLVVDNIKIYQRLAGKLEQEAFYDVLARDILMYAGLILGMALLRGLFLYLTRQTVIVTSRLIEYDFKNEIFTHYQVLPVSFYKKNSVGDMMNRISEDVSRVRMYLGPSIMYGLQLVILFLILIPIMLSISPVLTLYALVPLPILSASIYFVHSMIEHQSEKIQRSQSELSALAQETFSGIRVLKSFARERESIHNFSNESEKYMHNALRLTWIQSFFFPLMTALIGLSTVLVVYAGSVEVIRGTLTIGHIAEFIIYVNLLTWPVISLGWVSSIVQRAEASQKRLNEFLKTPPHPGVVGMTRAKSRPIQGKIEFRDVSFIYPDTGIEALKKMSFTVFPGETLAIIGNTGSGKSTIVSLLGRLYDATEGTVLIDDIPIRQYNLENLRSQMGFVPQDAFLFSDTIYQNIAFGLTSHQGRAPHVEEVAQVSKYADVYHNIKAFPNAFDTRVGERGVTLSGGQKQRLALARAIIRKPEILVLDDSLSAVDTKTENTILNHLDAIAQDKTCIIVSHRVSSAKFADRIIVLHDGAIIEEGTHDNLIARSGAYYTFYHAQVTSEENQ